MKWSELSIHTTNEAVEPISNILHEAGASGVVIEDSEDLIKVHENEFGEIYDLDPSDFPVDGVIIKAYLPVTSFLGETVEEIKLAITNLINFDINIGANEVSISEVNEEEWATAWKKYYHPVKISNRFTIVPTWEMYEPVDSDELIIELDPGMAFGTGTHPTTVMSLQALEKYITKDSTVIDVGTGSGVLAIGAAMLGAKHPGIVPVAGPGVHGFRFQQTDAVIIPQGLGRAMTKSGKIFNGHLSPTSFRGYGIIAVWCKVKCYLWK